MRILVFSPIAPYPPHGGWPLVVYNDILHLARRGHELYVLAITHDENADPRALSAATLARYYHVPRSARWRRLLSNVGCSLPFNISRYYNRDLLNTAAELITTHHIDVLLLEDVAMGTYGPPLRSRYNTPFVIRGHNVDTEVFERFVTQTTSPVQRFAARWQLSKLTRYERNILREADAISMITERDAEEIRRRFPELKPVVVGAGTDLQRYRPPAAPRDPFTIVHVGSLSAFTKLEAMQWFVRSVLPRIRAAQPSARLVLAGQTPPDAFAGCEGVEVLGRVDDERPCLHLGRVFVAPQFVGSGVRLKILNAMATGNAIVCTRVACEGIPLQHERHAMICDEASGFASAVLRLLHDSDLAARLGANARRMAEERYNWSTIAEQLEALLSSALRRRGHIE